MRFAPGTQTWRRPVIELGGDRGELVLQYCGHGHTAGDIVVWLPRQRVLVAGDLVEAQAALYAGDARTGPPPLSTVWQRSARRR